jgi:hypothetical protein
VVVTLRTHERGPSTVGPTTTTCVAVCERTVAAWEQIETALTSLPDPTMPEMVIVELLMGAIDGDTAVDTTSTSGVGAARVVQATH